MEQLGWNEISFDELIASCEEQGMSQGEFERVNEFFHRGSALERGEA